MSQRKPWGVNRISDMVSAHVRTQRGGKWVRSVPTPYYKNIRESIRAAWWVFTGKAEAVIWPEDGDLEEALTDAGLAGEPLELPYKNWRGEISTRKIQPIRLEFGATEWHPEPQWLLIATDIEKNAERSFALKDFNPQQTVPAVAELESNPETLRWWCQQLLDIIENYDISHDAPEEDLALLNDIRAAVDPASSDKSSDTEKGGEHDIPW